MPKLVRFFLSLLAVPALAQEPAQPTLWDYLRGHVSVVSGVASANGERSEFVSLALDDSFEIRPKLTGFGNLSLFGRQRIQGVAGAPLGGSELPTSLDDLALYSAGEITAGAFFQAHEKVAIECRGAMTFAMTGLTGTVGDPVDSSKFTFGCGPRVSGAVGRLSVIFGHSGPVDEGAKWYGFIPSTVYDGSFRLTDTTSFLVFVAAGRDLATNKAVTSARFSVRKAFR